MLLHRLLGNNLAVKQKEKIHNKIKQIIVAIVNILIKAIYLVGGIRNLDN